ncbi:N-acetylmuramidase family protein [Bosea sp. (in: a-proteobacteria)]
MVTFKGAARRLDDIDLPRVGALIGVGEDEIHAVLDVEASGSGFDAQGRVKALYEPHKAYALSSGAVRAQLVSQGLAYPKWGEKPYPKDSYPRILKALEIDETVALNATSWGLGQIMGFNHVAAGYTNARAMVEAFAEDEEHHLEAMIRFIIANGLDDELRRHDWAGFARGYNGSGYAKNAYDAKLAAAFAKWAKIKDTPYPAVSDPVPAALPPKPAETVTVVVPILPPAEPIPVSVPAPAPAEPASQPGWLARFWAGLKSALGV